MVSHTCRGKSTGSGSCDFTLHTVERYCGLSQSPYMTRLARDSTRCRFRLWLLCVVALSRLRHVLCQGSGTGVLRFGNFLWVLLGYWVAFPNVVMIRGTTGTCSIEDEDEFTETFVVGSSQYLVLSVNDAERSCSQQSTTVFVAVGRAFVNSFRFFIARIRYNWQDNDLLISSMVIIIRCQLLW